MANAHQAIFLSYASQDAGAAKRICDALRAAGLEVWFDQNELRGGDAWDQKIRNQIKECALFVPVISANTQARPEGYFRLEWKLAVDRSHLMADDQPFIIPVVVDDTSDTGARVPEKFREVQWTRLVLTEMPAAFAARLSALLGGNDSGDARQSERESGRELRRGVRASRRGAGWRWWMIFPIGGMLFALAGALRPYYAGNGSRGEKTEKRAPNVTPVESEARQMVAKAKVLYEPWDGATREDFALAEQLLKRATELDPTDGEVWATYGILTCGQIVLGYDRSPARLEIARGAAERALRLAPESLQARFAQAFYFRFQDGTRAESERILRELVERAPTEKLYLRTLGAEMRNQGRQDESVVWFDRAAALPGGDPVALYNKSLSLWIAQRYAESEAVIDQALDKFSLPYLYRAKVRALTQLHGDLDGAAKVQTKVPAAYQLEDAGVLWASQLWLWRREPEKCLAALRAVQRDVIENDFGGPKTYLTGRAYQVSGRTEAAQSEWRAALQVTEQQLTAQPNAPRWIFWKAHLLGCLGRTAEGEQYLHTYEQLIGATSITEATMSTYLVLGRREQVLTALEELHARLIKADNFPRLATVRNSLRFDPTWDSLRGDARFEALLQPVEGKR